MQIHITSSNSTETLAHYLKVCSCRVYREEYAVNFIICVLVLYKKQCSYIDMKVKQSFYRPGVAQDGGKVVSVTHRPPLPPGNTPGTHFC